ncbi:MAG: InlB B-repeat-containing protein [Clostridia bacterium]|nr:InlB B-repeat-containing protein [Clostridia bacterium]
MKKHTSSIVKIAVVALIVALCVVGMFTVSAFANTVGLTITNFQTQMRDGGDYRVEEDLVATAFASVVVGNTVSIDLNNYSMSVAYEAVFTTERTEPANLTITGDGTVTSNNGDGYLYEKMVDGTIITIKGGTYDIVALSKTASENITVNVQGGKYTYDIAKDTSAKVVFPTGYTVAYNDASGLYEYGPIEYTITYENVTGATNTNPTTYTVEDAITLAAATKDGYTFDGWKDAEGNTVTSIAAGTTGDITLTAAWTVIDYNITYNLDGGTNAEENPATYTVENAVTFAAPTKAGYTFKGWVDANGDPITGIAAGTIGDVEVTATWEIVKYTITYNPEGGTTDPSIVVEYTVNDTVPLSTPTKPGYTFDGWVDAEGNKLTEIPVGTTGDITLTATWTAIKYNIIYNGLDGATNAESNPATFTVEDTVTFADASKVGHLFTGWLDASGNPITEIPAGTMGDIEVTATFQIQQYTLTIIERYEDGTELSRTEIDIDYASSYTYTVLLTGLNSNVKNGYVPDAWELIMESMPAEATTVYVTFYPLVVNTEIVGDKVVVSYYDGTKEEFDITTDEVKDQLSNVSGQLEAADNKITELESTNSDLEGSIAANFQTFLIVFIILSVVSLGLVVCVVVIFVKKK